MLRAIAAALTVSCATLFPARATADFKVSGSDADKTTWEGMLTACKNSSTSVKNLINKIKQKKRHLNNFFLSY